MRMKKAAPAPRGGYNSRLEEEDESYYMEKRREFV
jgi:hypothetical protein